MRFGRTPRQQRDGVIRRFHLGPRTFGNTPGTMPSFTHRSQLVRVLEMRVRNPARNGDGNTGCNSDGNTGCNSERNTGRNRLEPIEQGK